MENERKLMHFFFLTTKEASTHYHQDPEIIYVLKGSLEIKIDESVFLLKPGDFLLINANKSHSCIGKEDILGARFVINFHMLAEYMGSLQLMFWCNTVADKNDAYSELRSLLDAILERYFEKEKKDALYLNALYYQTLYVLTSNFMVKADDVRLNLENSQDRIRVQQIQNYIQANYQSQISLNDLAERLYLSNAYLSKYIKKHLGLTFLEYLNNVRLFHAIDELLYTNKSITHIALDNGFPTSAAFTKAFRDIHKEAPSEYRKRMQNQMNPGELISYLEDKEEKDLKEYLRYRENQNSDRAIDGFSLVADMSKAVPRNIEWNKAVNIGSASELLQSETQNQLREICKETGIRYIRIWNVLLKEFNIENHQTFNFRKLDLILDFITDNHMKPYIDFGNRVNQFRYTVDKTVLVDKHELLVDDFQTFRMMIHALCVHLINRYGADEVETWIFELWKFGDVADRDDVTYYQYFDELYRDFKQMLPNVKIGGAGLVLGYQLEQCRSLFKEWGAREIHPDFISFVSYQYVTFSENGSDYGRCSIDSLYMENQIELIRQLMDETDFHPEEIHIGEWNFTLSNRNVINDSCEQGAYLIKTCISMMDKVDFMAYWHALDTYSEYRDFDTILNGDSGMISPDGIRKPSFYAMQFWNKLQPMFVAKNRNAVVTTNGRGHIAIVCHNFKKLSSRYVFSTESEIQINDIDQYLEDTDAIRFHINLTNIHNGKYQIKTYYINRENGSAQDIWKKMECAKSLSKDEVNYIKLRSMPTMELHSENVENENLEMDLILQTQEIRLIEIQYRYGV